MDYCCVRKTRATTRALLLPAALWLLPLHAVRADDAKQSPEKPNIIIILADDLGWKDVGYAGSTFYRTPHIDRLAREGLRFEQAYSAACVCSPSRGAIYSGKNPARTGLTCVFPSPGKPDEVWESWDFENASGQMHSALQRWSLPRTETTFGEVLSKAGYATAFFGKWHCGEISGYEPFERGWQLAKGYRLATGGGSTRGHWGNSYPTGALGNLPDLKPTGYLADVLTDEAVKFIRGHKAEPFHLVLAHYLVHTPLQAKPGTAAPYEKRPKSDQQNTTYAAMVASLDESVGHILQTLANEGLAENTLVVFTSDNGGLDGGSAPPTSNYPLLGGKFTPFEGGLRVPLAMRWPRRIKAGSVCTERVVGMDFYPTFLEAAGLPLMPQQHVDGVSLMPLMCATGHLADRPLIFHFPHYARRTGPNSALIENDWKLIRFYNDAQGRYLLFDLAHDPYEQKNLAQSLPEKVRQLETRLTELLTPMGAKLPTPNEAFEPTGTAVGTLATSYGAANAQRAKNALLFRQAQPVAQPRGG